MITESVVSHGLGMGQKSKIIKTGWMGLWAFILCCGNAYAASYSTTQTGALDGTTGCTAGSFLERTIAVPDVFVVDDLNVGILITHDWRGDVPITLISPAGTSVELVAANTASGNEDNYNIELDDGAAVIVNTGVHDSNDGTVAPPYENIVRPSTAGALGTFTGQAAQGNWTLRLCDAFPTADDGIFQNAALYFTSVNDADLSLTIAADDTTPVINGGVNITATLSNSGPQSATGVSISIPLPAGLTFVSASGDGSYDSATGIWTPSAPLQNGGTQSVTLFATVAPVGPYAVSAQITAAEQTDPDSAPGNNSGTEDDEDSLTLSPVPPASPPPLSCPAAVRETLPWSAPGTANGWNTGTLTNNYSLSGRPVDITLSGNTNRLIARNGVQTPVTGLEFTGGAPAGDYSVLTYVDFAAPSEFVLWEIDVGTPGEGVSELQFDIFDVDQGVWTDRVRVQGFFDGALVNAVLTPSASNSVSGDTITGTGQSASTQNSGNANVSFLSAVDRVELRYDNASTATNPEPQVFSIFGNFAACPPLTADLSAQKTVAVYDPAGLGLYAVPGQDMLYTITVENSASATASATDIVLTDVLPDTVTFISASLSGFTGAVFDSPPLPPANTDCTGGACVISVTGGTLPIGTTGELLIRASVK